MGSEALTATQFMIVLVANRCNLSLQPMVHIGHPRAVRDEALAELQRLLADLLRECLPGKFKTADDISFEVPCLHCKKHRFALTECKQKPQLFCEQCDTTRATATLLGRDPGDLVGSSVPMEMGCEQGDRLSKELREYKRLKKEFHTHPTAKTAPAGVNQEVLQKSLELCWDYMSSGVRLHRAGHIIAVGPAELLLAEGSIRGRNSYGEGTQPCFIQTPDGMEAVKLEMNQDGAHIIDGASGRVRAGKFFSKSISSKTVGGGAGAASAQGLSEVPGSVVFKISGDGPLKEFRLGEEFAKHGGNRGTFDTLLSEEAIAELVEQENNKIRLMISRCPVAKAAPAPMSQDVLQATLKLCWEYSMNGIEGHKEGHVIAIGVAEAILQSGTVTRRNNFAGGADCYIHTGSADVKIEMNDDGAHIINGRGLWFPQQLWLHKSTR